MSAAPRPDVERLPADLDRYLGSFFSSHGWRSEIKYDPAVDRLYLEVRLADVKLSSDDRFFSLVEYFARVQDRLLRQRSGLPLQCRLYSADGRELTPLLHTRGSSYLDDDRRGSGMRRRLVWLRFRRRLFARVLPEAAAWAVALAFVVEVVGVRLGVALGVALAAVAVQALVLFLVGVRHH
jgi:hypothetical protein